MGDFDWDALDILSRAKMDALSAVYDAMWRVVQYEPKGDLSVRGPSIYDTMEAWRWVSNAWDRVLQDRRP